MAACLSHGDKIHLGAAALTKRYEYRSPSALHSLLFLTFSATSKFDPNFLVYVLAQVQDGAFLLVVSLHEGESKISWQETVMRQMENH
jgi:hypothetical protein